MQHKPMKHKRISVSLPIPLLAKIYLLWQAHRVEYPEFNSFVSHLLDKAISEEEHV